MILTARTRQLLLLSEIVSGRALLVDRVTLTYTDCYFVNLRSLLSVSVSACIAERFLVLSYSLSKLLLLSSSLCLRFLSVAKRLDLSSDIVFHGQC